LYPRVSGPAGSRILARRLYEPQSSGIQAAVSVGLGVSFLPDVAVLDDHRVLRRKDGLPPITNTQLALLVAPDATSAARRLADLLAEFCGASATRNRSIQSSSRTSWLVGKSLDHAVDAPHRTTRWGADGRRRVG